MNGGYSHSHNTSQCMHYNTDLTPIHTRDIGLTKRNQKQMHLHSTWKNRIPFGRRPTYFLRGLKKYRDDLSDSDSEDILALKA